MSKKHLVVFGGSGWVGSNIVRLAVDSGRYEVTSFSRGGRPPANFADAWAVQWQSCDASNRTAVQEALASVGKVDAVISCVGLLTLERSKAIVMNGQANTNIIASIYNRQQMILHDRALDAAAAAPEGKSAAAAAAAAASAASAGASSGSALATPTSQAPDAGVQLRVDDNYNEPHRAAPNTALLHRRESEVSQTPFAIRKGERSALPALTDHASGLPRVVFVSAANFGWPFTKILRGYYDGKIAAEKAMLEHVGARGAVLRPGAIHGTRRTASGIPIPLSPVFWPMELVFPLLHRLTGLSALTPPSNVRDVARAALAAAETDLVESHSPALQHAVNPLAPGYGFARGGVINYSDTKDAAKVCPIFEYEGISSLSRSLKK